jgi:regulatory protein
MPPLKPKAPRDDPEEAFGAALRLLARREHGTLELTRKLEQRGFAASAIGEAIERLRGAGYLSDDRFAGSLARHRLSQGYGEHRIRAELQQHGLDGACIRAAIESLGADWDALAADQARRHFGSRPVTAEDRQRVLRYLTQRGFSAAAARSALSGAV